MSTTITKFAEKNAIDLIVMGTKGATGLKELFVGSNTSTVVTHSKRPVLAIPINSLQKNLTEFCWQPML